MDRRTFNSGLVGMAVAGGLTGRAVGQTNSGDSLPRKLKDVVIYSDDRFYSAFPSIVVRPGGELLLAFRRAPNRNVFGENRTTHTDPNSYLVSVRSADNGETWTKDPELIHAHAFGGSQDPCMVQLRDGTILCSSYAWARFEGGAEEKLIDTAHHGPFVFLGGYIMRSTDGGHSWAGPIVPPPLPETPSRDAFGRPVPSYNRGAMCQGRDGRLYWVVAGNMPPHPGPTSNHLLISADQGSTWNYSCPVAVDEKVTFNEASLYETPKGDLVAFLRTADFDDHTVVVRSRDGGKSFEPWEDSGFQGHPHYALRLPDDRVFLVYGYRHKPYGIRARVLDAECTNFATAPEIVLREDGGGGDLGYPWAALLPDGRVLAVYYFNIGNGTRHIAGTVLSV